MNTLFRLKDFLEFKERKTLIESSAPISTIVLQYVISVTKSHNKRLKIYKKNPPFLQNDYASSYDNLLENSNKSTMTTQRLRTVCLEFFKTLHQLNLRFISNIFEVKSSDRPFCSQQNLNLKVVRANHVKFGEKSLRVLGPKYGINYHHIVKMLKTFLLLND